MMLKKLFPPEDKTIICPKPLSTGDDEEREKVIKVTEEILTKNGVDAEQTFQKMDQIDFHLEEVFKFPVAFSLMIHYKAEIHHPLPELEDSLLVREVIEEMMEKKIITTAHMGVYNDYNQDALTLLLLDSGSWEWSEHLRKVIKAILGLHVLDNILKGQRSERIWGVCSIGDCYAKFRNHSRHAPSPLFVEMIDNRIKELLDEVPRNSQHETFLTILHHHCPSKSVNLQVLADFMNREMKDEVIGGSTLEGSDMTLPMLLANRDLDPEVTRTILNFNEVKAILDKKTRPSRRYQFAWQHQVGKEARPNKKSNTVIENKDVIVLLQLQRRKRNDSGAEFEDVKTSFKGQICVASERPLEVTEKEEPEAKKLKVVQIMVEEVETKEEVTVVAPVHYHGSFETMDEDTGFLYRDDQYEYRLKEDGKHYEYDPTVDLETIKRACKIDSFEFHSTAMHFAVRNKRHDLVRAFLDNNASADGVDATACIPLALAIENYKSLPIDEHWKRRDALDIVVRLAKATDPNKLKNAQPQQSKGLNLLKYCQKNHLDDLVTVLEPIFDALND